MAFLGPPQIPGSVLYIHVAGCASRVRESAARPKRCCRRNGSWRCGHRARTGARPAGKAPSHAAPSSSKQANPAERPFRSNAKRTDSLLFLVVEDVTHAGDGPAFLAGVHVSAAPVNCRFELSIDCRFSVSTAVGSSNPWRLETVDRTTWHCLHEK